MEFCERNGEPTQNASGGARRGGWARGGGGGGVGNERTPRDLWGGPWNQYERVAQTDSEPSGQGSSNRRGSFSHRAAEGRRSSFDSTSSEESDPSDQSAHAVHDSCWVVSAESPPERDPPSGTFERIQGERTGRRGAVSGIHLPSHVRRRTLPGWDES